MNQKDAYKQGIADAMEHGRYGDFSSHEISDLDAFVTAIFEIDDNSRQYAGHVSYDFAREPNSEALFDAYERGLAVGARRAYHAIKAVR